MMHPDRLEFKDYLTDKLGDVPFILDRGQGIWDTCKRSWQERDKDAEFHLVIQDDAIVCDNFQQLAEKQLKKDLAYSFYFGYRGNLIQVAEQGLKDGQVIRPYLHWGIAVCLHQDLINQMINFGDSSNHSQHLDDTRIKEFLLSKKINVCYPMPSLIDHRSDLKSFVTNEIALGRKAYAYIDRDK